MEEIRCPKCKQFDLDEVMEKNKLVGYKCFNCQSFFEKEKFK